MTTATIIGGQQIASSEEFTAAVNNFNKEFPPKVHKQLSLFQLKIMLSHYAATWVYREGTLDIQVNLSTILTDLGKLIGLSEMDLVYILGVEIAQEPAPKEAEVAEVVA